MENNVESGKSRSAVPMKPENDEENQEKDGRSKSSKKHNSKKKTQNAQSAQNSENAATAVTESSDNYGKINPVVFVPTQVPSTYANFSVKDIQMAMDVLKLQCKSAKTPEEAMQKPYQFWSTQPVPKMDEKIVCNEPIEPDKVSVRADPYSLPAGFHWDTLNVDDPLVLAELYTLLSENYVEDDDAMFRFDYPPDFLKWALQPPGGCNEWHCAVRVTKSNRLVCFISAIPAAVRVYDKVQKMVEINFLCVHKKLRSKRVAPVLIHEITRRVNLMGIFQAVYTAGIVLPKPISTCRYWHRSLNPKKLIEIKFSHLSRNMTMQRTLKFYKLPETTKVPGFRKFASDDVAQCHKLLNNYLNKFDLAPIFTQEEFTHWFMPQTGIVDTFVVENPETKLITDMVSYYTLPSSVMHHQIHKTLRAAYSFYNVSTETPWLDLMQDALISARNLGFDVFNALDLMDNKEFLEPLKFGIGDGNLQYYLYNWRCPSIASNKIGIVLQ
ncbi:PREDICTED: glycylpeptide N-tetradecanoyltransferase 2 [Ceratosolen solmsi marchali]|uniref:Glycylpeptide N-tetradecanoyltransferase n=1 Tax=Ceratosolen solmsi marchali TaxID=326594 RepID=A0AAJ6VLP1_9HYME|nr:PREDICTED: glycylpeptide N-tetradecanoyltransferase 2 [Ceratosolen solmsi marchali]